MRTARLLRLPQLARLLMLVLTFALTIGLFAPRSQAAPVAPSPSAGDTATAPADRGELPPPGADSDLASPSAHGHDAASRPQNSAPERRAHQDSDPGSGPAEAPAPSAKTFGLDAEAEEAAACDPASFSRTGAALVRLVKAASFNCVDGLFRIPTAYAAGAFNESQMLTVIEALRESARTYQGNDSDHISQLMYYVQAGYSVQWTKADVVGSYDRLPAKISEAVHTFFANPRSLDPTTANAVPLERAAVLADVPRRPGDYVDVVKQILNAYQPATWDKANLLRAVNPVTLVLYRGVESKDEDFRKAVVADPGVVDALNGFILRAKGHLLDRDRNNSLTLNNAIDELTRLKAIEEIAPRSRAMVKNLVDTSGGVTGPNWPQRASAVASVQKLDQANCGYYGTCDDPQRFKDAYLPVRHTCSPTLRILGQDLTAAQLATACASLNGQDVFFHGVSRDRGPVADDGNAALEVVAFDSDVQYVVLGRAIFNTDTNNGGIYLEGEPSRAGNQARFLAYEEPSRSGGYEIRNLNHEYTHYLDARFNLWGSFQQGWDGKLVWWTEGLAEVVATSYQKQVNQAAIDAAARHSYRLSELFDTDYGDQDRVYRWGYLAVRYMLEQHRSDVDALLAKWRAGDWAGSRALLKTTIGTRYDADFDRWLSACAAGACATVPEFPQFKACESGDTRQLDKNCVRTGVSATAGNYAHFYINVPAGTQQIKVTSSGGTGNADLYYHWGGWAYTNSYVTRSAGADNSETLTITNPPAGYVFFSLYAQQGFSGVTVTSEF
ncbi:collagenase [Kitasatospora sp. NPDC008115]|uniref:M9 family metallopeptidase n=1 Tax=Kitasatospora sp. NPDC008115 TaxID=3364022 RepID=UPI0036E8E0F9